MEGAVGYALNRDKTEQSLFESAIGCTCETAFADMCAVKKMWKREKGVQGYHLVQSFAEGEVTPQLAHKIGVEFANRLLGGQYQAVISTHLNTAHIHNHILWNSVNLETGKKYHSNAHSYYTQVRKLSDALCKEHGLSVIQPNRGDSQQKHYAQWLAERQGLPTWKSAIQQDIDEVIGTVFTWNQFVHEMQTKGYTFRFDRKYPTLQPPGKERPVRLKTLGKTYTPEALRQRILYPQPGIPKRQSRPYRRDPHKKLKGLQALYYAYLYQVGALARKPRRKTFAAREDIRQLDKRIEQMEFIFDHEIADREQLEEMRAARAEEIERLLKQRYRLYRTAPGSPEISAITERLCTLRREERLCRDIAQHSIAIEERMRLAKQEQSILEESRQEKPNPKRSRNDEPRDK